MLTSAQLEDQTTPLLHCDSPISTSAVQVPAELLLLGEYAVGSGGGVEVTVTATTPVQPHDASWTVHCLDGGRGRAQQ